MPEQKLAKPIWIESAHRGHEYLAYSVMGFSVFEIAEFFETTVAQVLKHSARHTRWIEAENKRNQEATRVYR